jgi:hypothetical protein
MRWKSWKIGRPSIKALNLPRPAPRLPGRRRQPPPPTSATVTTGGPTAKCLTSADTSARSRTRPCRSNCAIPRQHSLRCTNRHSSLVCRPFPVRRLRAGLWQRDRCGALRGGRRRGPRWRQRLLLRRRQSLPPAERPEVDRVVAGKDVGEHYGRRAAPRGGVPCIKPELKAAAEGEEHIPRAITAGDLPRSVPSAGCGLPSPAGSFASAGNPAAVKVPSGRTCSVAPSLSAHVPTTCAGGGLPWS